LWLQTKIIEINLLFKPEVADAILGSGQFSHYDRPRIAQLCEKAGLYMRAMQHYTDLADIRRVMANTHAIQPEALKEFFGDRLSAEWALECLGDLVQQPQNLNLAVDIAVEYTDAMGGWEKVLEVLEGSPIGPQAEFAYLARRISTSEDPEEHYRCTPSGQAMHAGFLPLVQVPCKCQLYVFRYAVHNQCCVCGTDA
jgi:clathrin heavy chain